ncbi:MAG TPA: DMT family transporter [Terriglobales bacterium]|nr:DMT family transporter [Terriglobales bacterium]
MSNPAVTSAGLSLAAAACWGTADFNGGLAAKGSDAFGVVVVAHGAGLLCMLAFALATGEPIPPRSALLWGAAAGLAGGIGLAALYRALAIGQMGINAPVAAMITAALPVVVSFRTEGLPTVMQFAGFALALLAIGLIAMPSQELGRPKGLGLAVVAGVGFGGFLVLSRQAATQSVFWPLVMARAASMSLMLVLVTIRGEPWKPNRALLRYMLVAGIVDSFGNALFVAATRRGRLDVAAVLSSLYPAATVLLARFLLKERISRLQTTGMAAALIAVPMIAGR